MNEQHEADEAQIRQQIARIAEGIRAKDLDAIRQIYATNVVSFDVEPPLQHVGVDAKLKNWARIFTIFREPDYEVRDLAVTVGGDVAFAHCFGRVHGVLGDGTTTEGMWVRGTLCFQRIEGAWQIVHDQASVPFDMPSGRGLTDLKP
jgi:ketosteroid isomerase-like protein